MEYTQPPAIIDHEFAKLRTAAFGPDAAAIGLLEEDIQKRWERTASSMLEARESEYYLSRPRVICYGNDADVDDVAFGWSKAKYRARVAAKKFLDPNANHQED